MEKNETKTIRGIRGAITVRTNEIESVRESVIELLVELKKNNNYDENDISHIIFTMTSDLDCVYPAKIAREEFPILKYVPMMCMQELEIKNSLKMCLRVLVVINTSKLQEDIKHIYLRGAKQLREDLV